MNVLNVENYSAGSLTYHTSEFTLEKSLLSAVHVGSHLVVNPISLHTGKFTLVQGLISVGEVLYS